MIGRKLSNKGHFKKPTLKTSFGGLGAVVGAAAVANFLFDCCYSRLLEQLIVVGNWSCWAEL